MVIVIYLFFTHDHQDDLSDALGLADELEFPLLLLSIRGFTSSSHFIHRKQRTSEMVHSEDTASTGFIVNCNTTKQRFGKKHSSENSWEIKYSYAFGLEQRRGTTRASNSEAIVVESIQQCSEHAFQSTKPGYCNVHSKCDDVECSQYDRTTVPMQVNPAIGQQSLLHANRRQRVIAMVAVALLLDEKRTSYQDSNKSKYLSQHLS